MPRRTHVGLGHGRVGSPRPWAVESADFTAKSSGTTRILSHNCLQREFCKGMLAVMATSSITPSAAGLRALSHPDPAADADAAPARGAGHGDPAGPAAQAQHRRDVVPPPPARRARLHRRGHRARRRPRPLVEGRPPEHPRWASPHAREEEAETAEAYLQTRGPDVHRDAHAGRRPNADTSRAVAGGEHHQRLAPPAHAGARRAARRGDGGADRGLVGGGGRRRHRRAPATSWSTSTRSRARARWSWKGTMR